MTENVQNDMLCPVVILGFASFRDITKGLTSRKERLSPQQAKDALLMPFEKQQHAFNAEKKAHTFTFLIATAPLKKQKAKHSSLFLS